MNVLSIQAMLAGEAIRRIIVEHPSGSAVLAFDAEDELRSLFDKPVFRCCTSGTQCWQNQSPE